MHFEHSAIRYTSSQPMCICVKLGNSIISEFKVGCDFVPDKDDEDEDDADDDDEDVDELDDEILRWKFTICEIISSRKFID